MTYAGYDDDLEYLEQYRDDGDENVRLLEPLLAYRLASAYRRSRRMRDHVTIESAGRTRAEQQYLYDGYKAGKPGFNLAANPDRIIGRHGSTTFVGSWHMEQPDGHTYAVDLTHHGRDDWDNEKGNDFAGMDASQMASQRKRHTAAYTTTRTASFRRYKPVVRKLNSEVAPYIL